MIQVLPSIISRKGASEPVGRSIQKTGKAPRRAISMEEALMVVEFPQSVESRSCAAEGINSSPRCPFLYSMFVAWSPDLNFYFS